MTATPSASPDDIELDHLFSSVRRRLPRLLFVSALAGALAYGVASLIAPRYEALAALEVMARDASNPFRDPRADGLSADTVSVRMDQQAVNTHVRAIQSSDIATRIAAELNLERRAEFNAAVGPVDALDGFFRVVGLGGPTPSETVEDRVLNAYYARLQVSSPPDSRVIEIGFQAHDPALAADIANAVAANYQARLANMAVVETDGLQKALAPKIEVLADEVAKADANVAAFRSEAGLLEGGAQKTPLSKQQLGDLTTELTKASAARTAAEARANSASQLMRRGTPEIIPEVQRSPLIQNLIQQKVEVQRDLLKASATMKSAHPVIRQLEADLLAVRRQVGGEVANVVASLEKEALVAKEQERSIRTSLEAVKATVADTSGAEVKLKQLQAVAASKRAELERLRAQFEANRARADQGVVPVEARILTRARPSSVPVAPKKAAWAGLTALGVLLIGLAIAVTAGLFTGARRNRSSTTALSRDRMVGGSAGPAAIEAGRLSLDGLTSERGLEQPDGQLRMAQSALRRADTRQAEGRTTPTTTPAIVEGVKDGIKSVIAVDALVDQLCSVSRASTPGLRTLMVNNALVEAHAAHALEVADALASRGNTVAMVNFDSGGDGIAAALQLPDQPGFNDLLAGPAKFADVIKPIDAARIQFIPSGSVLSGGLTTIDAERLNLILDALDEAYDHVVIVAREDQAAAFFEAIEGRVDIGVAVVRDRAESDRMVDNGIFLGFEVTDIELVRFVLRDPKNNMSKAAFAHAPRAKQRRAGELVLGS